MFFIFASQDTVANFLFVLDDSPYISLCNGKFNFVLPHFTCLHPNNPDKPFTCCCESVKKKDRHQSSGKKICPRLNREPLFYWHLTRLEILKQTLEGCFGPFFESNTRESNPTEFGSGFKRMNLLKYNKK